MIKTISIKLLYLASLFAFVWATYDIGWVKFIVACISLGICYMIHDGKLKR